MSDSCFETDGKTVDWPFKTAAQCKWILPGAAFRFSLICWQSQLLPPGGHQRSVHVRLCPMMSLLHNSTVSLSSNVTWMQHRCRHGNRNTWASSSWGRWWCVASWSTIMLQVNFLFLTLADLLFYFGTFLVFHDCFFLIDDVRRQRELQYIFLRRSEALQRRQWVSTSVCLHLLDSAWSLCLCCNVSVSAVDIFQWLQWIDWRLDLVWAHGHRLCRNDGRPSVMWRQFI